MHTVKVSTKDGMLEGGPSLTADLLTERAQEQAGRSATVNERCVLDSFAILALLGKEPGGEVVPQLLGQAEAGRTDVLMTWVNAGEVAYIVGRRWGKGRVYQVLGALEATAGEMKAVERDLALTAAEIKAGHQLAYPDAFAAALAIREDAVLVTGDPEFRQLEGVLPIEWLLGAERHRG